MSGPGATPGSGESGQPRGDTSERYVVRAFDRSLALLVLLAGAPSGMEASALARAAGLHVSTVFRILQTLRLRNFVVEAPGALYKIGPRAFEVGNSFLRNTSLQSEGQQIAERLGGGGGETGSVGIPDPGHPLSPAIRP